MSLFNRFLVLMAGAVIALTGASDIVHHASVATHPVSASGTTPTAPAAQDGTGIGWD